QSADLELRGKVIGTLFTVHPALAALEDFAGRLAVCELNFEALAAAQKSNKSYKETSKFPAIHFDVSFSIDRRKTVREIENALLKKGPKILKNLRLFDIYEGDKIEAGKKSLAFSLTLQAEDRTLTGSDLEEAQKLTWKILEDLGAQIRGK
ncbi:MAG: phenylalanine--tRNA ligase subunit beta, partial [Patescibacteria group bacterium]